MLKLAYAMLACLVLLPLTVAAEAPSKPTTKQVYAVVESDSRTIQNDNFEWRPEIKYKHRIKIVTNLTTMPSECCRGRETDFTKQLFEYLMDKHPDVIEKMRGHGLRANGNGYPQEYDPKLSTHVDDYKAAKEAKTGSFVYEVLILKDFSYSVDRYVDVKKKAAKYEKAMEIIMGKAK